MKIRITGAVVMALSLAAAGLVTAVSASARPLAPVEPEVTYASVVTQLGTHSYRFTVASVVLQDESTLPAAESSVEAGSASATPDNIGNYTDCLYDGAISVENCAQLDYDTYVCSGSVHCGTINDVYLTYYQDDPTARVESYKWIEGAAGRCHRGCTGGLGSTHDFGWHSATSGHTYHYQGYWHGQYTELDKTVGEQRGGTSKLDWEIHGHSYELDVNPVLNDDGTGGSDR
jgi:hypothetical protein